MSTSTLHISLDPQAAAAEVPIEVRRDDLRIVARGLSTESVEVEPGQYFVSGNLPDGREARGRVEVKAGESATVDLALDPPPESPPPPQPAPAPPSSADTPRALPPLSKSAPSILDRLAAPIRRWLDDTLGGMLGTTVLGGDAGEEEQEERLDRAIEEALEKRGVTLKLRAFSGNVLREPLNPVEVSGVDPLGDDLGGVVRLASYVPSNLTVQLIQPGFPAVNATLMPTGEDIVVRPPAYAGGPWRLGVRLENQREQQLLRYIERGAVKQASLVAQSPNALAESALRSKIAAPIPAAVGAYVLLRIGDLDRLHDWTRNLRDWIDWLPDGVAIYAEHLARQGKHAEALAVLLELPQRGLPAFSDGLTYAVDRLRLYTDYTDRFDAEALERGAALLDQLRPFATHADFTHPGLTYAGSDPAIPDARPVSEADLEGVGGFDVRVPRL